MYLLGLSDASTARRIGARDAERLRFAAVDGLAAICATAPPPSLWRGRPLEHGLDWRRLMEMAAAQGPFVAAAPGAKIPDPAAALDALGEDLAPFLDILRRFGLRREHRIAVTWDARAALRGFADRDAPELALARALGRERFGERLAQAMATERRRLGDWALAQVQSAAEDTVGLPAGDDDQIVNIAAMTGPGGQGALDAALARIGAQLPGKPGIRREGPLPAISFAAIELARADAKAHAPPRRRLYAFASIRLAGAFA